MDTNYILKKAISKINERYQKNKIIGEFSIDIQNVKPFLITGQCFSQDGLYIFIDENFNILKYVAYLHKIQNNDNKQLDKNNLKLLKQKSKFVLFIRENDRDYKKYDHYKQETKSAINENNLYRRLLEYKKQKHSLIPYHQIIQYSEEIFATLSHKLLYDHNNSTDWDAMMEDFVDTWNNFKYYYIQFCNGKEDYQEQYLYFKSNIITFYKNMKKEIK